MPLKYKKQAILLLIILTSLFIRLSIASMDVEKLLEKIIIDDSFYEFSIAKNIAQGSISYNGIDTTNGFQPLWTFLIASSFFITKNIYTAVNIILIYAAIVDTFTLLIIFKFTERIFDTKTAFLSSTIYGFNPFVIFQSLNGLESVLDVFLIVLVFYLYYLFKENWNLRKIFIIGLILGLSLLTRTDNVFLLAIILFHIIWSNKNKLKKNFKICFMIGLIALFIFSPFLIWSLFKFGRINQSSYIARYNMNHGIFPFFDLKPPQSLNDHIKLIAENTYRGLGIILHHFGVINFSFFSITAIFPIFIALILLFSLKNLKYLSAPILYSIAIFSFYCFYFLGVQIRYFTPFMPFLFILFSLGLQNFCKRIAKKEILLYFLLLSYFSILFYNGVQQWNQGYFSWHREIYKDALWLKENTQPSEAIACFSSGIPTYFSERRVINMDGVLNGEAIEALKNKSVIAYMKSKNITIWIDSVYFNQSVVNAYKQGLRFNILENNLWKDFLGPGKEDLQLIEQREGIYKHLRGFEMLVVFFKAKIKY